VERAKSLVGVERGAALSHRSSAVEWALPAVSTALCLLALCTLLTPATFGPIGALMLMVFVVGLSAMLRVPLHETMCAEARLRPYGPHAHEVECAEVAAAAPASGAPRP
jgi:hypothetical protein